MAETGQDHSAGEVDIMDTTSMIVALSVKPLS